MKQIAYLLGFLLLSATASAQKNTDIIRIAKGAFGGTQFVYQKKIMKPVDLLTMTQNNEAAYKEMMIAKTNHNISTIFSTAGSFFLGYGLGYFLFTEEVKLIAIGTGIALVGVSIPFSIGKRKHAKKGAIIYNNDLQKL